MQEKNLIMLNSVSVKTTQKPAPNIKNESNFFCADIKIICFQCSLEKIYESQGWVCIYTTNSLFQTHGVCSTIVGKILSLYW